MASMGIRMLPGLLLIAFFANPAAGADAQVERTARDSLFAEGLGTGLLYSVNYERMLMDDLGVRLGFGYFGMSASATSIDGEEVGANVHFFMFPISVSYIGIGRGSHSLELGAGANLMYVSGSSSAMGMSASGSGVGGLGHCMVGYRYQPLDGGFQFRAGFDAMFGPGLGGSASDPEGWGFQPWFYISLGGSFGNYTSGGASASRVTVGSADPMDPMGDRPGVPAEAPASVAPESLPFPEPDPGEVPAPLAVLPAELDPRRRPIVNANINTDAMVDRLGMPSKMHTQSNQAVFIYVNPVQLQGIRKARFIFNDARRLVKAELWPDADLNDSEVIRDFGPGYHQRKSSAGHQVLVWPDLGLYVFVQTNSGKVKAIRLDYS